MIATVSGTVAIIAILCYVVYPKSVIRTELCYFFPNYILKSRHSPLCLRFH